MGCQHYRSVQVTTIPSITKSIRGKSKSYRKPTQEINNRLCGTILCIHLNNQEATVFLHGDREGEEKPHSAWRVKPHFVGK